jgi:hypothetical protein
VAGYLTLAPELDVFRQQFEALARDADALAGGLSDAQFNWKPPSGGWSVAGCLEHLNITTRSYLPALDEGIADAIRRGLYGEGPFRYGWFARTFVKAVGPGARIKARARKAWLPPESRPRQETLAAFRAYQVQCVDRLRQANGLDLARAKVKSPASSLVRLPLGAAFAVLVSHAQRHLEQARRVLAEPAFPR